MHARTATRLAGGLYLGIIILGLTAELALRGPIASAADQAAALAGAVPLWRAALAADLLMASFDIALALLLYRLFRRFGPDLALAALVLRLVQMAVIAAHLPLLLSAIGAADPAPLIARHGAGYDLGLWFFGLNALVMALLLRRTGTAWLAWLIAAAGAVYLFGSLTRFAAPELNAAMQPAYLVPVVAELSFAIWLLFGAKALRSAA
ncbi:hypothetical protein OB2597_02072 [Pseudooceanicola batsensis HTCC2597]|uniref:DUF4386 domain-containing protein n=1 Tax=Pseudooceanicola batsensis (strain ATCC BAA-863 / DSM 15984 / KCTC 12145 / HTCC2597) TaxID=252305 RepID=A3TX08_PSEBH|nr:DUF4386 domain-containing protein [Pseudooceanicola batsensis]EAQ03368.1 hypothetical protein OB2597_02072 [Pseudooceanicola batsensis HTCC2597]